MVTSLLTMVICIIDIVYKGRKEQVTWRTIGKLGWFYHLPPSDEPFWYFSGYIWIGFRCPSVYYDNNYYLRHDNNPIKISFGTPVFAFLLLCSYLYSKFCEGKDNVFR